MFLRYLEARKKIASLLKKHLSKNTKLKEHNRKHLDSQVFKTWPFMIWISSVYLFSYLSIGSRVPRAERVARIISGYVLLRRFFHLTSPGSLHAVGRHQDPAVSQRVVTQVLMFWCLQDRKRHMTHWQHSAGTSGVVMQTAVNSKDSCLNHTGPPLRHIKKQEAGQRKPLLNFHIFFVHLLGQQCFWLNSLKIIKKGSI